MESSSALVTDAYQLTMAAAYEREGLAGLTATFSLFVRSLPPQRAFLVAAGLDEALSYLERLSFDEAALKELAALDLVADDALARLRELRFTGEVRAVPEGTIVLAEEPLLEVRGPLIEAQLVESYLLNAVTTATTLASKAARLRLAASGRRVYDFALRRAQGIDAAMALARAVAICGIDGTSNVAGASRYGLVPSGTMAHSYVQAHASELDAFVAFGRLFRERTVLLVDTYAIASGVAHAIEAASVLRREGIEIRAVRIDSGELDAEARAARTALDRAGFPAVEIMASGGLDERQVARLVQAGAPIDAFGVGTDLGVSRDAPVLDSVYKLVELAGQPQRKRSPGKATWPGAKQVWRASGLDDVLALADEPPQEGRVPLLEEVMVKGVRTDAGRRDLHAARERFEAGLAALPSALRALDAPPARAPRPSPALAALTRRVDAQLSTA